MPLGASQGGGRRGASVKTLKRMLKKAGLKTSGRKAALTRRAKKAHLKVGGDPQDVMGGRRRRHRGGLEVAEGEQGKSGADEALAGEGEFEEPPKGGRRRRGLSRRH